MISSMPMECISINKEGAMLYQDKKGYEDYWRKHHVSPIARDIWMYTPGKEPQYRQLTTFGGEDREPVWAPDGKTFYYLSEENGSFNIYRRTPGDAKAVQLTHYTKIRYAISVPLRTEGCAMDLMVRFTPCFPVEKRKGEHQHCFRQKRQGHYPPD